MCPFSKKGVEIVANIDGVYGSENSTNTNTHTYHNNHHQYFCSYHEWIHEVHEAINNNHGNGLTFIAKWFGRFNYLIINSHSWDYRWPLSTAHFLHRWIVIACFIIFICKFVCLCLLYLSHLTDERIIFFCVVFMFIHFSRKCPFIFVPNTNCHAMVPFVRQFSFWIYTFRMAWRLNERVREKKLDLITKVHRTMEIFIMKRVFISTMDFIFLSNKCLHFFDIFDSRTWDGFRWIQTKRRIQRTTPNGTTKMNKMLFGILFFAFSFFFLHNALPVHHWMQKKHKHFNCKRNNSEEDIISSLKMR